MARAEQLEAEQELAGAQHAQHTQQLQQQQADLETALQGAQQQAAQLRQQLMAAQTAGALVFTIFSCGNLLGFFPAATLRACSLVLAPCSRRQAPMCMHDGVGLFGYLCHCFCCCMQLLRPAPLLKRLPCCPVLTSFPLHPLPTLLHAVVCLFAASEARASAEEVAVGGQGSLASLSIHS